MKHQHIADKLNERGSENLHPFVIFLLAFALAIWIMTFSDNAHAADADLKLKIMVCESGLKHNRSSDGGKSYGIAMFRNETFYEFAARNEHKMRLLGMWPARWKNPQHQLFLLDWALDNGYQNRWRVCYQRATG